MHTADTSSFKVCYGVNINTKGFCILLGLPKSTVHLQVAVMVLE